MSATEEPEARAITPASRLAAYLRGGGVIVPVLTTLLAFFIGGLVMLLTGKDPIFPPTVIFSSPTPQP